ncbi:MAG: DUF4192 family protein [Lawsonella sp.]
MHKDIRTISDLLAQAPSLFGFNPEDSVLVYFGKEDQQGHFQLGPTIRINVPQRKHKNCFRYSLEEALARLAYTECRVLYIAIVRAGWHHPSRFPVIEYIEQVSQEAAASQNCVVRDVVVLNKCRSREQWISVVEGTQGKVSEVESSPLALERYWDGIDIGQNRADTKLQLLRHVDDPDVADIWGAAQHLVSLPIEQLSVDHCLDTTPNSNVDCPKARYMRRYFLDLVKSHQSCDGLMPLLVTSDARKWVGWMWALTPTYEEHDKALFLFVVGIWHYMRGDGFRCEVLLERAAQSGIEIAGLTAVKDLLALCVEPQEIITVVQGIARRIEQSA